MAAAVSALGGELGLRLLLTPAASHVIVRTACTVVGIGFPIYSTHKAIEANNHTEQEEWLVYWAAYGCFSVAEVFSDKLLSWCPFYYHAKFVFLVWLQLPKNYGARHLYTSIIRPVLLKHHVRLDRIVDGTRNEMNKFLVSHQHEVQAVQRMLKKFSIVVYQAAHDALQSARALEGGANSAGNRSSQEGETPHHRHHQLTQHTMKALMTLDGSTLIIRDNPISKQSDVQMASSSIVVPQLM